MYFPLAMSTGADQDGHSKALDAREQAVQKREEEAERIIAKREKLLDLRETQWQNRANAATYEVNVGGVVFTTTQCTLTKYPDTMLAALFSGKHTVERDPEGRPFLDRSGKLFEAILDGMREDVFEIPNGFQGKRMVKELEFYGLNDRRA